MENYQIIAAIISFVVFSAYVTNIAIRYGILPSISDSFYIMKNPYLFTLATWGYAIPMSLVAETPLMFFAMTAICFVGAAPQFKDKFVEKVHVIGAVGGVVFGLMSLIFDFHLLIYTAIIVAIIGALHFTKVKNSTWWIEITAYVGILGGTLLHFLM